MKTQKQFNVLFSEEDLSSTTTAKGEDLPEAINAVYADLWDQYISLRNSAPSRIVIDTFYHERSDSYTVFAFIEEFACRPIRSPRSMRKTFVVQSEKFGTLSQQTILVSENAPVWEQPKPAATT